MLFWDLKVTVKTKLQIISIRFWPNRAHGVSSTSEYG